MDTRHLGFSPDKIEPSPYRVMYPEREPYAIHHVPVSSLHSLYVEEVGNPKGYPVVFLHGGPGGGISPNHRRLFDPAFYRIILFDQRGAGQSTPHANLTDNTTWHLVEDLHTLRKWLGIDQWLVFGGSWGSTLALAYAQTHPQNVSGLILRGIFLCRRSELLWFYQHGCNWIFPEFFEPYWKLIPEGERHDMMAAYYKRLTNPDPLVHIPAAKAWSVWEGSACKLIPDNYVISTFEESAKALAMARIECHYFMHHCFFDRDDQLLHHAHRLKNIPTWIVHGRYDVVCPVKNALDLHRAMPHATLNIIADAGHAYDEPGILNALIEATDAFARQTFEKLISKK